jgi:uncharacterized membrane protein
MARNDLATLVVGYDDVDIALTDFRDLAAVRREHRVGDYEAAVVRRTDGGHDLVETTVDPRHRATLVCAGLGVVVGAVISPVIAAVVLGAGLGAVAGDIVEKFDAFKHADMREVERLVDDSTVNLIAIADEATLNDIATAAGSRGRRVVVPFSPADVGLLERELQRATTYGRT